MKESQILAQLESLLLADTLTQMAKKARFVQRSSKLTALTFLQVCLMSSVKACSKSLSQVCMLVRETVGVKIRKQSLDERFTQSAVAFVRQVVEALLAKQLIVRKADSTAYSPFQRVLIGDCTSFALPPQFTTTYKGPGGKYPGSAIKLYYEYDFLSGTFSCLAEDGWARSDQTFNSAKRINKGDLVLKDLGFYQVPFLRELHQKGAYFVSRIPVGSRLFRDGKPVALSKLVETSSVSTAVQEFSIGIGSNVKERVALGEVRLILEKVPLAVYEQKMRRTKVLCASKGRQPSKDQLFWNQYNLFITNIPQELLSVQQVRNTYRVRWQIEILFKAWKSVFQIHQVKPMQLYRFQCLLWSSLLLILLFMPLLGFFKQFYWLQKQREVSEWKLLVWLKNHVELFCTSLPNKSISLWAFAQKLYDYIQEDGFKEKRNKKGEYSHLMPFDILFAS